MFLRVILAVAIGLPSPNGLAQSAMTCIVNASSGETTVIVKVATPHASNLLITAPDKRRIYLRDLDTPIQFPASEDFTNMGEFEIDRRTQGTWFNDWGESDIVAAIGQAGEYELYIADNLENEQEKSPINSCKFTIDE